MIDDFKNHQSSIIYDILATVEIVQTILPIFLVIVLGWLVCRAGYMPPEFLGPANRLVYFLAIPAMIFRAIANSSFSASFNITVLGLTLMALLITTLLAWGLTRIQAFDGGPHQGSFIQCAFHGNLGYVGLAVAYYTLGAEGLTQASILAGFIMIVQNLLGVLVLNYYAGTHHINARTPSRHTSRYRLMLSQILRNPVIAAAMGGILYSISGLPLPALADRMLGIVAGMALPMALLIIGASLSFKEFAGHLNTVCSTTVLKLVAMPAIGLLLYQAWGLAPEVYMPGLILLAAPTATVAYVLAKALNGQAEFTVAVISLSTLLSLIFFTLWIHIGLRIH